MLLIFFLIVNTKYYWERKLGFFAFPMFLFLLIFYLGIGVVLVKQIYFLVKNKTLDKTRLITIGILILVLILTFLKPSGIIDFERFESDNILIAEREGSANCMTTLKLKEDFTFSERSICFGINEIKGNYHLQNDTIYFDKVSIVRNDDFYEFAVMNPSKSNKDDNHFDLILYKSLKDTVGHKLWITKNNLNKLKNKKSNN
jgi:hypothetical protein